jgi:hypothetical protein
MKKEKRTIFSFGDMQQKQLVRLEDLFWWCG